MTARRTHANRWRYWMALACLGLTAACRPQAGDEGAAAAATAAPASAPQPPALGDAAGPWVLRYFAGADGNLVTVKAVGEIPEAAREQVLVSYDDPALQGPWLYVADCRQKEGGQYRVRAEPRDIFEAKVAAKRNLRPQRSPAAQPARAGQPAATAVAADNEVIIYRTAWCGYCKKAAEYLRLKGVAFVEKDIEQDAGARADMLQRANRAGFPAERLQGVPVLAVRGKIIPGFDRGAIDRALGG